MGGLGSEKDQASADAESDGFGAALCAEFGHDGGDVKLDGVFGDTQTESNGFVSFAFGEAAEDLGFAGSEGVGGWGEGGPFVGVGIEDVVKGGGMKDSQAGVGGFDGGDDFGSGCGAREDGAETGLERVESPDGGFAGEDDEGESTG